jgi:hypothetical protein
MIQTKLLRRTPMAYILIHFTKNRPLVQMGILGWGKYINKNIGQ